jgi:hypothetical protein
VEETKKAIKQKKIKDLEFRQNEEMEILENNYRTELEDCNQNWNLKFKDLEDKSAKLEQELNSKHEKEMEDLYNFLEEKLPKNVKFSRDYLEFKKQEQNLVKQQMYKDAGVIKKKIENLEKQDFDKFNQQKTEKIKSKSIKTANKHLLEKNALKQKIESELELIKKQQQAEMTVIVNKYRNRKYELELQQKNEKNLYAFPNKFKSMTTTNKLKDKKALIFGNTMSPNKNKFESPFKYIFSFKN